jgi:hypothetical protein
MLKDYVVSATVRGRLHQGIAGFYSDDFTDWLLILISYQDDTNYGMLRVVSDDRRNAWQDLDR